MKKTIVFGISSSIAAFKVLDLIKKLRLKVNCEVIMTKSAAEMVNPNEFEKVTGKKAWIELFQKNFDYKQILKKKEVDHISLSDKADLIVIAPTTANIIGKLANGIADDLLTTTVMASLAKVIICPSMNVKMWQNPIVQNNVKKLRSLGYWIIEPEKGQLACGYKGIGRLADVNLIENEIHKFFSNFRKLEGKNVLVTAGGTSEYIDPVRIITNESSGRMGIYIAEEFAKYNAKVTLISANAKIEPNFNISQIKVKTSKEMFDSVKKHIKNDIIIHSAAVSDFTLKKSTKKLDSKRNVTLKLARTVKILDQIKKWNKNAYLVGFKAEYKKANKELIDKGYKKLKESSSDLLIVNDVGRKHRGFDSETNEIFIIDKNKNVTHIGLTSKRIIAEKIIEEVLQRYPL